jgi:predicted anti-sigma-YlaC factor YlaD
MAVMNCEQVREELELSFGGTSLSDEAAEHIARCESCRAYREELAALVGGLGEDDNIDLSPAEIKRTVRAVEERIGPKQQTQLVSLGWFRPVVRLAAAAALILFAWGAYEVGRMQGGGSVAQLGDTTSGNNGAQTSFLQGDLDEELDDGFVSVLIDQYSSDYHFGAGEALIGDISEEEMEYLVENLKVGDLL